MLVSDRTPEGAYCLLNVMGIQEPEPGSSSTTLFLCKKAHRYCRPHESDHGTFREHRPSRGASERIERGTGRPQFRTGDALARPGHRRGGAARNRSRTAETRSEGPNRTGDAGIRHAQNRPSAGRRRRSDPIDRRTPSRGPGGSGRGRAVSGLFRVSQTATPLAEGLLRPKKSQKTRDRRNRLRRSPEPAGETRPSGQRTNRDRAGRISTVPGAGAKRRRAGTAGGRSARTAANPRRRKAERPSARPARAAPSWWGVPCRGRGRRRSSREARRAWPAPPAA